MRTLLVWLAFVSVAVGADHEFKVPIPADGKDVQVSLPFVGDTVRLVLMPRYENDYPAFELGKPTITQLGDPKDYDRNSPIPDPAGDFDKQSYKQELVNGGRAISIEFVVPKTLTVIAMKPRQKQFQLLFKRIRTYTRFYAIVIRPTVPFKTVVDENPLPLAPGLE